MVALKRRSLTDCVRDRRGTSAIEFALILPILLILMLAGIQLVLYINAVRRVGYVASSIGEMISATAPPQGSTTATSTPADIHFAYDSALVLFPYVMQDAQRQNLSWWQDIEIDFSSVKFKQISTACNGLTNLSPCYLAQVAWTASLGSRGRACVVPLVPASDSAPASQTTLPSSIFGPGSVIVIDVYFTFRPTFGSSFIPPVSIARTVYMKPRYADSIGMDFSAPDPMVTQCPGF